MHCRCTEVLRRSRSSPCTERACTGCLVDRYPCSHSAGAPLLSVPAAAASNNPAFFFFQTSQSALALILPTISTTMTTGPVWTAAAVPAADTVIRMHDVRCTHQSLLHFAASEILPVIQSYSSRPFRLRGPDCWAQRGSRPSPLGKQFCFVVNGVRHERQSRQTWAGHSRDMHALYGTTTSDHAQEPRTRRHVSPTTTCTFPGESQRCRASRRGTTHDQPRQRLSRSGLLAHTHILGYTTASSFETLRL